MATGLSSGVANAMLDALCRNVAWTPPAAVYVQLHTADPGAAGTANVASNTTRTQATFGSAASGGAIANTATVTWTNVPTAEDYSHYSAWSANAAGTFLFSGVVTANPMQVGDTFQVAAGGLPVSLTPIAA